MLAPIAGGLAGGVAGAGDNVAGWAFVLLAFVASVGVWIGRAVRGSARRRWVIGGAGALVAGLIAYVASVVAAIATCGGCLS